MSLRSWRAAAAIAWDVAAAAPLPLLASVGIVILNGARTGAYTYFTAGLVNGLVRGHGALPWAAAFAAVAFLEDLTWSFGGAVQTWFCDVATLHVQRRVLARAASVPLVRLSDPEFADLLARATGDLGDRLARWLERGLHLVRTIVQTSGLLAVALALGGGAGLAVVVVAASIWGLFASVRNGRVDLERSRRTARPRRIASAWSGLLSGRAPAAEVRLFGVQDWLRARWEASYAAVAREELRSGGRQLAWGGFGMAGGVAAYGAILAMVAAVAAAAGPERGAGVFAGLLQASTWMQGYFGELVSAAGGMQQHAGFIGDLAALFAVVEEPQHAGRSGNGRPVLVVAEGVSFRYPHTGVDALRDLTAHIAPGEVVALVGPNGAGKSTLAAVLLGLYDPASGAVRVGDGSRQGSAVFQDFARYSLTLRDNVGFGDLSKLQDDPALRGALRKAASDPDGDLDAWLGPEFGGQDLSGGQWLRVAIARGVLPDSGLIVLDEPTAAIDPLAEVDLVKRLLGIGRGKTAIVVSHRLGIARAADRILVMDRGTVVEEGTHADLLSKGGLYAQMWQAQASWYVPAPSAG